MHTHQAVSCLMFIIIYTAAPCPNCKAQHSPHLCDAQQHAQRQEGAAAAETRCGRGASPLCLPSESRHACGISPRLRKKGCPSRVQRPTETVAQRTSPCSAAAARSGGQGSPFPARRHPLFLFCAAPHLLMAAKQAATVPHAMQMVESHKGPPSRAMTMFEGTARAGGEASVREVRRQVEPG